MHRLRSSLSSPLMSSREVSGGRGGTYTHGGIFKSAPGLYSPSSADRLQVQFHVSEHTIDLSHTFVHLIKSAVNIDLVQFESLESARTCSKSLGLVQAGGPACFHIGKSPITFSTKQPPMTLVNETNGVRGVVPSLRRESTQSPLDRKLSLLLWVMSTMVYGEGRGYG